MTQEISTASGVESRMQELFEACQDGMLSLPVGSMSFLDEYFCSEYSSIGNCGPLFEFGNKKFVGRVGGKVALGKGPADTSPDSSLSPITNRGVTKYRRSSTPELQLGGYDGGVEVGFEGTWDATALSDLVFRLEEAKKAASEADSSVVVELCGLPVLVEPTGANVGMHYRYVFVLGGVRFDRS
jgi:hypothetical protein